MNQIIKRQALLPASIQRKYELQRNWMAYIAEMTKGAIDEQGNIYNYDMFKTASTLKDAICLKQAFLNGEMTEEMEAWFHQHTQNFLNDMERIPQEGSQKIMQTLASVSTEPEETGLLEDLLYTLLRRIS
jgi:hypothetical protein